MRIGGEEFEAKLSDTRIPSDISAVMNKLAAEYAYLH